MKSLKYVILAFACLWSFTLAAQEKFVFGSETVIKTTAVKSQDKTGTCWAYATISFIESEIMRMGGPELDLSEMFIVKHVYQKKARQFVLLHGMGNFSQGGQAHDVMNVVQTHGLVPENYYYGIPDTSQKHNHSEMETALRALLDGYIAQKEASPSDVWFKNIQSVLINYMGKTPTQVRFNNRNYSPVEYAQGLGIDKNNYVELSSYTHHPFYKPFDLEIPDNWSHDRYYNVPIDELIATMKHALDNGYSIVWDGDVTEDFFSHKEGVAFIPLDESQGFTPQFEKHVTQTDRQKAFYSWRATDDHLMHIVGMAKDKNGILYFKTKNSWGTENNPYGGYVYMSEEYLRMNTVAIMLHKQALDKSLAKKLF
ncbi:bleomycin hydrolase [Saccharicrinis carchari]|uniref:Aminopeptidase n=1 Tax=Saccharicrinis carchari TaxID=1168039 RepID=A0A521C0Q8_SACCC|nr:C1 family peptidase [Saccharicrinis carchari]SMO53046.1 bleomycin hydrolase [Saccharicrinis carchari]